MCKAELMLAAFHEPVRLEGVASSSPVCASAMAVLMSQCCLQISGLSAPIPPGAQFGYQPGGWGKPPVDEEGNPLYGDVFGLTMEADEDELVCC